MKGESRSVFRKMPGPGKVPQDPKALFQDLKRSSIPHLWEYQAKVLDEWHLKHLNSSDVAFQLPTGGGKTLVGLLMGEFRRRTRQERVAYLCPTRQLAHQVGEHAREYGIPARVLVGPQDSYSSTDYSAYVTGDAIAITTYGGVFNINPRLDDAHVLILDDSHSAESYIASLWSLVIERYDHPSIYHAVLRLFADGLSPSLVDKLEDDAADPFARRTVDMVPFPLFWERHEQLGQFLDEQVRGTQLFFPWSMIRENLHACQIFLTWSCLLLRPVIPPALKHPPFANAAQRIYMSATLGEGGDLERMTGVPDIERIVVPEALQQESTGRRFILFPDLALEEGEVKGVVLDAISVYERALILCPNRMTAKRFEEEWLPSRSPVPPILRAPDIEETLVPFTSSEKAVLVLTARYDGLDLPGDSCRLLVLMDLPAWTNAQERFLWSNLGATSLLRDRERTRVTQALGRCTRNPRDYSAVLVVGGELKDFCLKADTMRTLHPKLQAEIQFGKRQSEEQTVSGFLQLLDAFRGQTTEWRDVEGDMEGLAERLTRLPETGVEALRKIVSEEVRYITALWESYWESAVGKAKEVCDGLEGGQDLRPYRAWWYYLAGCAAWLWRKEGASDAAETVAKDFFSRAADCGRSVPWFRHLVPTTVAQEGPEDTQGRIVNLAVQGIQEQLVELGFHGKTFERRMKELEDGIAKREASAFAQSLELLGKLLGFHATRPRGQGVADCVWRLNGEFVIVFEAKTEQREDLPISLNAVRQANGHMRRAGQEHPDPAKTYVLPVIVSSSQTVDKAAVLEASDIYHVQTAKVAELARQAAETLRLVRSGSSEASPEKVREAIEARILQAKIDPASVLERLKQTRLTSLPYKEKDDDG